MPNFWALPPEINSTRIYLGPGFWPDTGRRPGMERSGQ
ncbi:PPE family protein [Mycobacterium tuberculosis]|nr:PPE family protein [Mycobacterium tuberculosis]CLW86623.1 PPE family protein [Mycobacterium tuberculosis]CLY47824.1 PPE family protein [Mycobacterium tuberculosis]